MRVILAQPRGFCAGVERAIDVVDEAIRVYDAPVYVRHEIVHNQRVVDDLRAKGAVFVDEVDQIPEGAPVVYSAHGVSKAVKSAGQARSLLAIDATCPLVTKVHRQVLRLHRLGYEILLVGHKGHPEVEGTLGQLTDGITLVQDIEEAEQVHVVNPKKVAYATQTTLSLDDTVEIVNVLRRRFPNLKDPPTDDICYATQNRQVAVKRLAEIADMVIVIGAANSSNSNRLVEVARSLGVPAYRVAAVNDLRVDWFQSDQTVAVSAGASVPEVLVEEVVNYLRTEFNADVEDDAGGAPEDVYFPLPLELREAAVARGGAKP
ncbi:MAG TPA: 4-hydroxy-3-methylbut-2-enyl diphosphate reductase [Dehalococcoidia bacterium]|jgi:4-hydroxy-3-methylbut-2-enyl diphosphate reductase|nr:4-hydroxy-3-methylbut-2-enyl diphosphate reductase [Dehalococcoidia bacterium]